MDPFKERNEDVNGLSLEESERQKYKKVWEVSNYGRAGHGLRLWRERREYFPVEFKSGLDIGCGRGKLMACWCGLGIDAWGLDLVENCLDEEVKRLWGHRFVLQNLWEMDLGRRFDVGICADVMEHIPEEKVSEALKRIMDHCDITLFMIANFPSQRLEYQLHLTLKPLDWWLETFCQVGSEPEVLPYDRREDVYTLRWEV